VLANACEEFGVRCACVFGKSLFVAVCLTGTVPKEFHVVSQQPVNTVPAFFGEKSHQNHRYTMLVDKARRILSRF
jgi:hypothetical protein